MPPNPETLIQRQICDWLTAHQIYWWRMSLGGVLHGGRLKKNPLKGFPDLCGVLRKTYPGVLFALEVKTKTGKTSVEQRVWIRDLDKAGAKVSIVRSLDDVIHLMHLWGEVKKC